MLEVFKQAQKYAGRTAIRKDGSGHNYSTLLNSSRDLARILLSGSVDLHQARIAFMVHPGFDYVRSLWAIWLAGGVAVPLCLTHPLPSLQYVIEDTGAAILLVSEDLSAILREYAESNQLTLIVLEHAHAVSDDGLDLPDVDPSRNALILYTSGTTNKPKGVVTTHLNIEAQISTLIKFWEWSEHDHILCVLPLHHVHGIINVVCCSLWAGATCSFIDHFSSEATFRSFGEGQINIFMAVPTIYFKLVAHYETLSAEQRSTLSHIMRSFRLMVSGSAALPVSVMEKWGEISGHVLLERYGMTELGMAISNPYHGERRPGYVGVPLPTVEVKLVDENHREVALGSPGEILVKGPNVFKEYWGKPDATKESFTIDGWFKTGDVAVVENGYYRIMGRNSVDIIKSGGYKISALEIEEVLRAHEWIGECAVVGLEDEEWGELVAAALVLSKGGADQFNVDGMNDWLLQRIAGYKRPRKFIILSELPRNAMGKVMKNEVKKCFL